MNVQPFRSERRIDPGRPLRELVVDRTPPQGSVFGAERPLVLA